MLVCAGLALLVAACGSSAQSAHHPEPSALPRTQAALPTHCSPGNPVMGHNLTIYSSLQLQGHYQAKDASVNDAELLALEQAHGRVGPYSIKFVELDDTISPTGTFDPSTVVQNATQAADDPSAIAYLGDDSSGATALSIPITNCAGLLQMAPESTDSGLTLGATGAEGLRTLYPSGTRTFARVIPSNIVQAAAQAEYQSQQGCQRIYSINDGGAFGTDIADGVIADDTKLGMSTVGNSAITPTETNFDSLTAKVAASGANCVFYGSGLDANSVALWDALASIADPPKLFGPNSLATQGFLDEIDAQSNPLSYITTAGLSQDALNDFGQQFYEEYESRFGNLPDPLAIFGYETMEDVLAAISADAARGPLTRAGVIAQIFAIRNKTSVLGEYSIDSSGDTTLDDYGAYTVQDGGLVFAETLTPTMD